MKVKLLPKLEGVLEKIAISDVDESRKKLLQVLIDSIRNKHLASEKINLVFICTHNSRRSFLAQIWAKAIAYYLNVENVECYSGGTESTAMYTTILTTLINSGFRAEKNAEVENSPYNISFSDKMPPITCFSKKYTHSFNPQSNFIAVLTCSQADEECPIIFGAEQRISIPYEDPKIYDKTEQETEKYEERSKQIATELLYVFAEVKKP